MSVYRQCLLRRPSELGHFEDVYWIDNKLAKPGKKVIDQDETIWTVEETYGARDIEDVEAVIDMWRRFRDVLEDH